MKGHELKPCVQVYLRIQAVNTYIWPLIPVVTIELPILQKEEIKPHM